MASMTKSNSPAARAFYDAIPAAQMHAAAWIPTPAAGARKPGPRTTPASKLRAAAGGSLRAAVADIGVPPSVESQGAYQHPIRQPESTISQPGCQVVQRTIIRSVETPNPVVIQRNTRKPHADTVRAGPQIGFSHARSDRIGQHRPLPESQVPAQFLQPDRTFQNTAAANPSVGILQNQAIRPLPIENGD